MAFTPKPVSQRDPRWCNETLGLDDTITIGTDGSTLTCLAILLNGYGAAETPSTVNGKLRDLGSGIGFLGPLIIWPGVTLAFPQIKYKRITLCRDQPAPITEINASLDAGLALLIEIDGSPSEGLRNHWVVLYSRSGDDYLMLDPWPLPPDNEIARLGSRYGKGREISEVITAVTWFEPAGSTSPSSRPRSAVENGLFVRVQASAAAGVRLRSAPVPTAKVIAEEMPGTLLHCLEDERMAGPRIGVVNQWLQVRDPGGMEGYIAAWYVERLGSPLEDPKPAVPSRLNQEPSAQRTDLTVVVSSQASAGLRLRDQPGSRGNILEVLMPGTTMKVLESEESARAKVGVVNQWLNVRLQSGMVGYVAAWYVNV